MVIKRFEEIHSWQKARELTKTIYTASCRGKFSKDFGLSDQIRRASVSIMSNIAEGFSRNSTKDFTRFLRIAQGSAYEVQSILYVVGDLNYLEDPELKELNDLVSDVVNLLGGFIRHLQTS